MKPPYSIPTMLDIAKVRPNGYRVASLFAGGGGSSLGYRMSGFKVVYASEFVPAAREVYEANAARGTLIDGRDIRDVDPVNVLERLKLKLGELDVLDGSPPCASFSMAGNREADWSKAKKYCVSPSTLVLCADMTWRAAGALAVGDEVVSFDDEGLVPRRKFRRSNVTSAGRINRHCLRVTTTDGASVVCSLEHRWLMKQGSNLRWKTAEDLKIGDTLLSIGRAWEPDRSYDAGYLAGIFDGEGCVSHRSGQRQLSFAQNPGAVLSRSVEILRGLRVELGLYKTGSSTISVNVNGGVWSKVRLLGVLRPPRLLAKCPLLWEGTTIGTSKKVSVVSIERVGKQEVVALSTSAKTFIADGLLSHNSDTEQRTDDLFFEYVRFIKAMQPRVFVAENVSGLVKGTAKGIFLKVFAAMKACGYRVEAQLLDAQWLGVPQARERLIFIGVRNDLGLDPVFPKPLPYRYSVRDALPQIMRQGDNGPFGKAGMRSSLHPSPTIGAGPRSGNGLARPSMIETTTGEARKLTIDEVKAICSFPADFKLSGDYVKDWERLGRAVPPILMRAVATEVLGVLQASSGSRSNRPSRNSSVNRT